MQTNPPRTPRTPVKIYYDDNDDDSHEQIIREVYYPRDKYFYSDFMETRPRGYPRGTRSAYPYPWPEEHTSMGNNRRGQENNLRRE